MFIYSTIIDEPEQITKFEQIYCKYRLLMFYRAKDILHDDHWAEDAVSEAFIKIAKNIKKIHIVDSAETRHFVLIIAERSAIDIYNKLNKRTDISLEEVLDEPAYEDSSNELSPLAAAIVKLPVNYRQVILLKFSEGYSNKEIADMLGYSVSKVEKLISRGKKKLQHHLQEEV